MTNNSCKCNTNTIKNYGFAGCEVDKRHLKSISTDGKSLYYDSVIFGEILNVTQLSGTDTDNIKTTVKYQCTRFHSVKYFDLDSGDNDKFINSLNLE